MPDYLGAGLLHWCFHRPTARLQKTVLNTIGGPIADPSLITETPCRSCATVLPTRAPLRSGNALAVNTTLAGTNFTVTTCTTAYVTADHDAYVGHADGTTFDNGDGGYSDASDGGEDYVEGGEHTDASTNEPNATVPVTKLTVEPSKQSTQPSPPTTSDLPLFQLRKIATGKPTSLAGVRPFEFIWADNKEYKGLFNGKHRYSLIIYDLYSGGQFALDVTTKRSNGIAFLKWATIFNITKLKYTPTVFTDGCGSMMHLKDAAEANGMRHHYLPANEPNLNLAEHAVRDLFDNAAVVMHAAGVGHRLDLQPAAVQYSAWTTFRCASTANRGFRTPHQLLGLGVPSIALLRPFYTPVVVTQSRGQYVDSAVPERGRAGFFVGFDTLLTPTLIVQYADNNTRARTRARQIVWDLQAFFYPPDGRPLAEQRKPQAVPTVSLPGLPESRPPSKSTGADAPDATMVQHPRPPARFAGEEPIGDLDWDAADEYDAPSIVFARRRKPRGRPPKGCAWDDVTGTYLPANTPQRAIIQEKELARIQLKAIKLGHSNHSTNTSTGTGSPDLPTSAPGSQPQLIDTTGGAVHRTDRVAVTWTMKDGSEELFPGSVSNIAGGYFDVTYDIDGSTERYPTSTDVRFQKLTASTDFTDAPADISSPRRVLPPIPASTPSVPAPIIPAAAPPDATVAADASLTTDPVAVRNRTSSRLRSADTNALMCCFAGLDHDSVDIAVDASATAALADSFDPKDTRSRMELCHALAVNAQKDLKWASVLSDPMTQGFAKAAYAKEFESLCGTIFTIIPEDQHAAILRDRRTTKCRYLLDVKRNGRWKSRCVKQGFLEDKVSADGVGFNYYSQVSRPPSVRTAALRPNRGNRCVATVDIDTAYLQSDEFPEGQHKYCWWIDPITRKRVVAKQSGPIYGGASAAARWNRTLSAALIELGFVQGKNDGGLFYHKKKDLLVCSFVDDLWIDGSEKDIKWFLNRLKSRFRIKEADWLTGATPIDYCGIIFFLKDGAIHLSMEDYVNKMLTSLRPERYGMSARQRSVPISEDIDGPPPLLSADEKVFFMQAVGCIGWLAQTGRPDVSYLFSRLSAYLAAPTKSALKVCLGGLAYLSQHRPLCIRQPLAPSVIQADWWSFYSDADFAGNTEEENKRRSWNGLLGMYGDAPVLWKATRSSVCFPHPKMTEELADVSSTATEIYAAGNATLQITAHGYTVEETGQVFPWPFTLLVDNEGCRIFIDNTAQKTTLRHIDCRQEWVQGLRNQSLLRAVHVPSADNLADIFTKILSGDTFKSLRNRLLYDVPIPRPA